MSLPLPPVANIYQEFFNHNLSAAWRRQKLYDPSYPDTRDADIWEVVRRNSTVLAGVMQRGHRVAGPQWRLAPADHLPVNVKAAAIMEGLMRRIDNLVEARYHLAVGGAFLGRAYAEPKGKRLFWSVAGTPIQDWWTVYHLQHIDRREWDYVPVVTKRPDGSDKISVKSRLYSKERRQWVQLEHPEWYIRHIYNDESGRLNYGRGILEALFFCHWALEVLKREGLVAAERWAQGITIIKVDSLRPGDEERTVLQIVEDYLDVFDKAKGRHAVVVEKTDEVDIKEPGGTGFKLLSELMQFFRNEILLLCTGSILPSGGNSDVGSNSRAQEEAKTTDVVISFDRNALDATMTRDLVTLLWNANQAQLRNVGLAGAQMPRFETIEARVNDPKANIEVMSRALSDGVSLKESEYFERIEMTPPGPTDKTIKGRMSVDPMTGLNAGGLPSFDDNDPKPDPNSGADRKKNQPPGAADNPARRAAS
jgi:hypothetical protein